MKAPINIPADEKTKGRIEREEESWTAPKLFGLGVVSLGIALTILIVVSHCQVAPMPWLP